MIILLMTLFFASILCIPYSFYLICRSNEQEMVGPRCDKKLPKRMIECTHVMPNGMYVVATRILNSSGMFYADIYTDKSMKELVCEYRDIYLIDNTSISQFPDLSYCFDGICNELEDVLFKKQQGQKAKAQQNKSDIVQMGYKYMVVNQKYYYNKDGKKVMIYA